MSSELKARIHSALTQSMKARNAERTQSLRQALSAIGKKEIDEQKDLANEGVEKILATLIKQIQETIAQAKSLGRAEIVTASEKEIEVLREFLPQQLSVAEVEQTVNAIVDSLKNSNTLPAGPAGMGAVMKQVMVKVGSRAEGKVIQTSVRKALGLE